jgi:perosamine synthetase
VQNSVPFYRPDIGEAEIGEVIAAIRSGWLTTGPRTKRFEQEFAAGLGASHAVALNSCTAALHLAVIALGLKAGQGVLVPSLTFAATAEVIRYEGGIPVLIDSDPATLGMDLRHAELTLDRLQGRRPVAKLPPGLPVVGMIPVHVGGLMMNVDDIKSFAARRGLWVVEDAAHAFPAAWRRSTDSAWQRCGQGTAAVSCFSFYANKTITTGEGGMAVTEDADLAARMRLLSLHGLSHDAWGRYSAHGSWDYRILTHGYKYNLTDIAAAIGIHQLAHAEAMRTTRESIAQSYCERLSPLDEIELPVGDSNRIHSWHLFPIRLRLEQLAINRDQFIEELNAAGIACSVHWRPLHLHPYYEETFGWRPDDVPSASREWPRLVSLPLFSAMRDEEVDTVVRAVTAVCQRARRSTVAAIH